MEGSKGGKKRIWWAGVKDGGGRNRVYTDWD
jgi:hypothetical protein